MEIARGAEAILIKEGNKLIKKRLSKNYRIKEIDSKLIKSRTRQEARLLEKLKDEIKVPNILNVDEKNNVIEMEFIEGKKLSEHFDSLNKKEQNKVWRLIGKEVALMHNENVIHGDLTTSNMILKDDQVYLIDFGLGYVNDKVEPKAVDLHLLTQAFESKHYKYFEDSVKIIFKEYKKYIKDSENIFERLTKFEKMGRYKIKKKQ